jgi:hypothetical protein
MDRSKHLLSSVLAVISLVFLSACGSAQSSKIPQGVDGETFGDLGSVSNPTIQALLGTYAGTLRIQAPGVPAQYQGFSLELTLAGRYLQMNLTSNGIAGNVTMNTAVGVSRNNAGGTFLLSEAVALSAIGGAPVAVEMLLLSGQSLPSASMMDCVSLAQPICEVLATRIQFTSDFHKL